MPEFFNNFRAALGFMTLLPCGRNETLSPERLGRFPAFYPLVGLVLGAAALAAGPLAVAAFPPATAALTLTVLLLVLTRGFHLDGLADAADGLFSHRDREMKLAIMKDSRQGAFGVMAIVLDVTIKIQLLSSLLGGPFWVLLLWPAWGRLGASAAATLTSYAGAEDGLGRFMVENSGPRELGLAALFTLGPSLLCGPAAFMVALLAGLFGLFLAALWSRTLGGSTGDLLGASVELTEIFALTAAYFLTELNP